MLSALRNYVAPSLSTCILSPSTFLNENRVNSVMSHMFLHIGAVKLSSSSSSSDSTIKSGQQTCRTDPGEAVKFLDENAFSICDAYKKAPSKQKPDEKLEEKPSEEKPCPSSVQKKSSCSALKQKQKPIDNMEKYAGGNKCALESLNQCQPRVKRPNDLDIAYGIPSVDENCFTVCYAYKKKLHEIENGIEPEVVAASPTAAPGSEPVSEKPVECKAFKATLPPPPVCKFTKRFRAKPGSRRLSHSAARSALKVQVEDQVTESHVEDQLTPKFQGYANGFRDFVDRQLGLEDIFVYTDAVKQNCTYHYQGEKQQLEIFKLKN